jgi:hypothetical protein
MQTFGSRNHSVLTAAIAALRLDRQHEKRDFRFAELQSLPADFS